MSIHRQLTIGIMSLLLGACATTGQSISEQTTRFPMCDKAQGIVSVDTLACNIFPCTLNRARGIMRGYAYVDRYMGGDPTQHFARVEGVEGMTPMTLKDTNKIMTTMLIAALQKTGCFATVEPDAANTTDNEDWSVSGDVTSIKADVGSTGTQKFDEMTDTSRQVQKAALKVGIALHQGDHLADFAKKGFVVHGKRVGKRENLLATFDWNAKRDKVGFGKTVMQDVANEIVTEEAVFITQKAAGSRITRYVTPQAPAKPAQ